MRLERGIDAAVNSMPESLRSVIAGLQCSARGSEDLGGDTGE
jgi:hypothetical protein